MPVPSRLRGAHPRKANGQFMSRASARAQIARLSPAKKAGAHVRPAGEPKARPRRPAAAVANRFPEAIRNRGRETLTPRRRRSSRPRRARTTKRPKRNTRRSQIGSPITTSRKNSIPTTLKPRPTTAKSRESSRDPLQIQISAHVQAPIVGGHVREITGDELRAAIAYRLDTGESPRGIDLRIVQWRNPGRQRADLRAWRTGDQQSAWETLKRALYGWLLETSTATVAFSTVRGGQRNRYVQTSAV